MYNKYQQSGWATNRLLVAGGPPRAYYGRMKELSDNSVTEHLSIIQSNVYLIAKVILDEYMVREASVKKRKTRVTLVLSTHTVTAVFESGFVARGRCRDRSC